MDSQNEETPALQDTGASLTLKPAGPLRRVPVSNDNVHWPSKFQTEADA